MLYSNSWHEKSLYGEVAGAGETHPAALGYGRFSDLICSSLFLYCVDLDRLGGQRAATCDYHGKSGTAAVKVYFIWLGGGILRIGGVPAVISVFFCTSNHSIIGGICCF